MKEITRRRLRAAAYILFAYGVIVTVLGLVPSLYLGYGTAALTAMLAAAAAFLLSLWAGAYGFESREELRRRPLEAGRPVEWTPENIPRDDENWLRVHGGPGTKDNDRNRPMPSDEGRR